jgi:hypothetical protein
MFSSVVDIGYLIKLGAYAFSASQAIITNNSGTVEKRLENERNAMHIQNLNEGH